MASQEDLQWYLFLFDEGTTIALVNHSPASSVVNGGMGGIASAEI